MEKEGNIMTILEAEPQINDLTIFEPEQIGSPKWFLQHETIGKLTLQAVFHASSNEDEFIKELLITYEKIPVLIHELIAVEAWKRFAFPEILKNEFDPELSFPLYTVLYHEAVIVNLLETIMYHKECCEAAEDVILDLGDYCHRKIVQLITDYENKEVVSSDEDNDARSSMGISTLESLRKQDKQLAFGITMKVLSILRYITDQFENLQFSVENRLLNTHDFPTLLVSVLEISPWTKKKDGTVQKYIDGRWKKLSPVEIPKITKTEGQIWIALLHMLTDGECQKKYEMFSARKNRLLKLRPFLTDVLVDQLPPLAILCKFLDHLAIQDPPPPKRAVILETIPEIWEKLSKYGKKRWKSIAARQCEEYFASNNDFMKLFAKRLSNTYDLDVLDSLLPDAAKCAVCGEPAPKKCSRCKNEWYCRRECQVKHWPKHKEVCDILANPKQ